jgi:hypothetical protein
MKRLTLTLVFALLACLSMLAQDATTTTYTFQTVNYPDDTFTQLLGINNQGVIAGHHGATINKGFTLVLPNIFTSENVTNSVQTQVTGINDRNGMPKTVGFYIDSKNRTHGFQLTDGVFATVDFPGEPFNQLLGVDNKKQAVGYYSSNAAGSAPDHAYIYDECANAACSAGVFELLVIPDSNGGAQATGINDAGNVCGFYIDNNGVIHGFLLVQGTLTTLNFPGSSVTATAALGIDNAGHVVGNYTDSMGSHGLVYTISKNSFESVDDPDGLVGGLQTTVVNGINDKGVLVGFYGNAPINPGFVATPSN